MSINCVLLKFDYCHNLQNKIRIHETLFEEGLVKYLFKFNFEIWF